MSEFGTSRSGIQKIFHVSAMGDQGGGALFKNVSQIAHDLQIKQTQGRELKALGKSIQQFFSENIIPEKLPDASNGTFSFEKSVEGRTVSLQTWTMGIFINAGQKAYFGDALMGIDSGLPQALVMLDNLSWQIFYQYPRFLRRQVDQLSARIRKTLEIYFSIPPDQRRPNAWFTQALEEQYKKAGLNDQDIAAQMLFLYWGQVSCSILSLDQY